MLDVILIFLVIVIPAIVGEAYVYIIKRIKFNKRSLIFLTCSAVMGCYLLVLYLSSFTADNSSDLERIVCVTLIYLAIFMLGFHSFHENFKRAFFNKRKNENINKDCSDFVSYYSAPKKAFIVSMIYLIIYYSLCFFISILIFSILLLGEKAKPALAVLGYIIALHGVGYLLCISFLRLLVKCSNCESYVFYIDRDLSAFNKIAKRAVKEKVLDCEYCYATYALDSSLNLEELRKQKKDRIKKDKEAKNDR